MLSDSTLHNSRTKAPTAMPTVRPATRRPYVTTTAVVRTAKQLPQESSSDTTVFSLAIVLFVAFAIIMVVLIAVGKKGEKKSAKNAETDEMKRYRMFNDLSTVSRFKCDPLINVSPYSYENIIANFLRHGGYRNARVTSKSGDYGADVIGTGLNGEKMCAQCKMFNRPVGLKPIQEVVAAKAVYGCTHAMVVSTSDFTEHAVQLARANGVKLVVYSDRIR